MHINKTVKTKRPTKKNKMFIDEMFLVHKKIMDEKHLINEVYKRHALWNFKLPLIERSLQIKKKLWEEIFVSMKGIFKDILTMKKKWKSLCDSFRMYKSKQHQPSGSAALRKCSWVHLERMQFLNDVQLENETTTNISPFHNTEESNDGSNFDDSNSSGRQSRISPFHNTEESNDGSNFDDSNSSGRQSRNNKRRLSLSDSGEGSLDRFVEALSQPITVNVPPFIPSSPIDKAASFGTLIAAQLREVNPNLVDDVMLQIMQIVNAAKRKKL